MRSSESQRKYWVFDKSSDRELIVALSTFCTCPYDAAQAWGHKYLLEDEASALVTVVNISSGISDEYQVQASICMEVDSCRLRSPVDASLELHHVVDDVERYIGRYTYKDVQGDWTAFLTKFRTTFGGGEYRITPVDSESGKKSTAVYSITIDTDPDLDFQI